MDGIIKYLSDAAAALFRAPIVAMRRGELEAYDNLFININGQRVNGEGAQPPVLNAGQDVVDIRFWRNQSIAENNFDLGQIAQAYGVNGPCFFRFHYYNQNGTGIIGKTNLTCPEGSQLDLFVNGNQLGGTVCEDDRVEGSFPFVNSPNTLFLDENNVIFANSGSLGVDNSSIAILGLSPDPRSSNSVPNVLGILPATPPYLDAAPYQREVAVDPSQNFDTNTQLFNNPDGTFSAFALDKTGAAPRLVKKFFTATGAPIPEMERDIFTYTNSGRNPSGVQQNLPTENTNSAGFDITAFAARKLPDGEIGLSITYSRATTETAGVSMVLDPLGNVTAAMRDVSFPTSPVAFGRLRRTIALVGAEVAAQGKENFFTAFSRGGSLPADGIFYNSTTKAIELSPVADHPVILPPTNDQIIIDGYSSASSVGGKISVQQFSNETALEQLQDCAVHVVGSDEEYTVGAPDDLSVIIIPPYTTGAVVTFNATNKIYTIVNQGGGVSYRFAGIDTANPVIDVVDVDGVASSVVRFGNNTEIMFVGQNVSSVTKLVEQLEVSSSAAPSTQDSTSASASSSKGLVTSEPTSSTGETTTTTSKTATTGETTTTSTTATTGETTTTSKTATTGETTTTSTKATTITVLPSSTSAGLTTTSSPVSNSSSEANPYLVGGIVLGLAAIAAAAFVYRQNRNNNRIAPAEGVDGPAMDNAAIPLVRMGDEYLPAAGVAAGQVVGQAAGIAAGQAAVPAAAVEKPEGQKTRSKIVRFNIPNIPGK